MPSQKIINAEGRSPLIPGDNNSVNLPVGTITNDRKSADPKGGYIVFSKGTKQVSPTSPNRKGSLKRRADKENEPTLQPQMKKVKVQRRTAHVGDHSITATEVTSQILADGLDATLIGQGTDILKQYIDTFFGPVPGFNLNPATGAYDANSIVASLESPGRQWEQVDFTSPVNLPQPHQQEVQYTRIFGSRSVKDSDVDINIPEVYQHGVVVPSKIGERVTNILPWARRSFENMARISLTGLERFDCSLWYAKGIFYSLLHTRLTQALIPIPIPDLINAPVQHMLLQDNAPGWQLQLATLQRYNEAGWLVLTEGKDFTKLDMLNVHLLAYGGAAFPADLRDQAVAAQSFRWPYHRILVCHTTAIPPFPDPQTWNPTTMIVWLRQLALARGEEDMLVQGYHTATQLVASEWIGRFGREPQEIPRWPGVNVNIRPEPLDPDEPYHWQAEPDDQILQPDINHWIFDAPNGARNGNELINPGPLQIPCPNVVLGQAYQQAMLAWERARDGWLHQPQRQGEAEREPEDYPFPAPVRPQAPVGSVRTNPRAQVWGAAIQGVDRIDHDDRQGLPMQRNPERLNDAEWYIVANEVNCYRALTPFYECNLLLDYPLPKDSCVVWRWAGVKRSTPAATAAATHPIFTCAVDLDGLLRLAIWQGGMLFSLMSTVFYNYNLSGSILQQISAGQFANQLLRQFTIERHFLTRVNDTGLNQPAVTSALRVMLAQVLKVQIMNAPLGIRNWACIQTAPLQEANSWLVAHWPHTVPLQHGLLSFARWMPVLPLEWGLTARGPTVNLTSECAIFSRQAAQSAWRGEQGSRDYAQRAEGARPFRQVAYGPLAVNVIWQLLPGVLPMVPPTTRPAPCIRRGTLTLGAPEPYPAGTLQVNNELRIVLPCTMPTYNWHQHSIFVPTILAGVAGHQNLAMLSRVNGVQNFIGFEWNPITAEDIPQFDPDDEDDDVLDAFAAMAMGAAMPAGRPPAPPAANIIPHQPPPIPPQAQNVAPPPQANPAPLGDAIIAPPGQVQGGAPPPQAPAPL